MYKNVPTILYRAACVFLLSVSLLPAAHACQVEDFFLTKAGNYAAATPEVLNNVLTSLQSNQAKLAELEKQGELVKLQEGIKVQVLERSIEWKMLKIKLPEGNATFWVKDGALKPVECK